MWRAYLSTSHLLFYNSPWKRGSLEVLLNTGLMTSTEGIWRTLENGRQLFKQRLLLFRFSHYSCFQYTRTSVSEHVNSLAFGTGPCTGAHLFILPIVRLEVSILFDKMHQGNRKGLCKAGCIWEQKIIRVVIIKSTLLLRHKQELEMVCVSCISKTCTIRATIWL